MLILSAVDVAALLDLDRLVDVVEAAMNDLSEGRASMPPRVAAAVDERDAILAAMPAFLPSAAALTTKLVSLFPRNRDRPTHQALICCFDPDDGMPLAVMDGAYITAVRTAAGSALATRLLARRVQRVAVVGTGVQARAHAEAVARLPGVEVVEIAGRDGSALESLVATLVDQVGAAGAEVRAAGSVEAAVRVADVVCGGGRSAWPASGSPREGDRPGLQTAADSISLIAGDVDGVTGHTDDLVQLGRQHTS